MFLFLHFSSEDLHPVHDADIKPLSAQGVNASKFSLDFVALILAISVLNGEDEFTSG